MPMLPARHYESEITQFVRKLIAEKPQIETEQKKSRMIWWDKTPDQLALHRQLDEGREKQKAYVYGSGE